MEFDSNSHEISNGLPCFRIKCYVKQTWTYPETLFRQCHLLVDCLSIWLHKKLSHVICISLSVSSVCICSCKTQLHIKFNSFHNGTTHVYA